MWEKMSPFVTKIKIWYLVREFIERMCIWKLISSIHSFGICIRSLCTVEIQLMDRKSWHLALLSFSYGDSLKCIVWFIVVYVWFDSHVATQLLVVSVLTLAKSKMSYDDMKFVCLLLNIKYVRLTFCCPNWCKVMSQRPSLAQL